MSPLTFAGGLPHYMADVAMSILPIVAVFFIFQMMTRRYQKRQRRRVLVGFAYTYVGLVLFLCGVNVGFGRSARCWDVRWRSQGISGCSCP